MQVPFREALAFWLKLGFISFGGPTGQIAILHEEVVERRKWVSEERFLHALNYCMLLPGPEAQQLTTYVGWLLHGTWGGIVAGSLFVLPSVLILLVLSWLYAAHGDVQWIAALFRGLQPAVVAIVACAVLRIGKKALKSSALVAVAATAFVALFFGGAPFPLVIAIAAALGLALPLQRASNAAAKPVEERVALHEDALRAPRLGRVLRVIAVCGVLWWAPVALAAACFGSEHVLVKQGLFFSKAAMVTFGGAYSVLPYVGEHAVERFQWLAADEMVDGLGLAETTPGPLIMVLQFVGFLGGWRNAGALPPWLAGTLSALMTTWVTFLPCFLWIFAGAPYIERLRNVRRLNAALAGVTAAVVGVVLNLAVWFGRHTLFDAAGDVRPLALALALVAFIGLQWRKWNVIPVVLGCGALGLVLRWLGLAL